MSNRPILKTTWQFALFVIAVALLAFMSASLLLYFAIGCILQLMGV